MCVSVRNAGQKVFGDLTAAEEAKYEPFRRVLSGDKLSIYNDRLKKYKLYGTGGKVLKTPEDSIEISCDKDRLQRPRRYANRAIHAL
jgi:hypothetical protein